MAHLSVHREECTRVMGGMVTYNLDALQDIQSAKSAQYEDVIAPS